jgi:hypothetical protein
MSSKLLTIVDRGVSHVNTLNTLVDSVLQWLTPKMKASAVTCSGLQWASNCRTKTILNNVPECGGGSLYTWKVCTQWYYNNGYNYTGCTTWAVHCGADPRPSYADCRRTCIGG